MSDRLFDKIYHEIPSAADGVCSLVERVKDVLSTKPSSVAIPSRLERRC